jgi:uncharacterized protein YecE (DUF72 family)
MGPKRTGSKRTHSDPIQASLFDLEASAQVCNATSFPAIARPYDYPQLLLGTCAFNAAGWPGTFYPPGMKPAQYISHYATRFKTVEIDSTFYGPPSPSTVKNWRDRTPDDFVFAVKVPQIITHEKALVNCAVEWREFFDVINVLDRKLGPLVFQFPKFDRSQFATQQHFLAVLESFLQKLPRDYRFAVEIRNKDWINPTFTGVLRTHKVALVLQDLLHMPRPWELPDNLDFITADFAYVRWLGDRKGLERITTTWDRTVVDRGDDLQRWAEFLRKLLAESIIVYTYANNHYSGNGPATISLFWQLLYGETSPRKWP